PDVVPSRVILTCLQPCISQWQEFLGHFLRQLRPHVNQSPPDVRPIRAVLTSTEPSVCQSQQFSGVFFRQFLAHFDHLPPDLAPFRTILTSTQPCISQRQEFLGVLPIQVLAHVNQNLPDNGPLTGFMGTCKVPQPSSTQCGKLSRVLTIALLALKKLLQHPGPMAAFYPLSRRQP